LRWIVTRRDLFKKTVMVDIKIPSIMCVTVGCPKKDECLRKTALVPHGTPSTCYTPQTFTPTEFVCKGFLLDTNKKAL